MPEYARRTNETSTDDYDYGPLRTYEITWTNGHVEKVQGHQVSRDVPGLFGPANKPARFTIHGQFGEHWRLVLTALEDDISTIRDVTEGEWVL